MDTTKSVKTKKVYLTNEEKANVLSRKSIHQTYDYIAHTVMQDIHAYLRATTIKRCNLSEDVQYSLSANGDFLEVSEADFPPEMDAREASGTEEAPKQ